MSAPDVAAYARAVRQALADVPPAHLQDLLEDLDEHLAEVAAEGGEAFAALGPPEAYAADLRRSAGLTGARTAGVRVAGARAAGSTRLREAHGELQDALQRARSSGATRAVLAFLPELRPAWWVLRAWLAVLGVSWLFLGSAGPLGPAGGLGVLGLPLLVAAVVVSVRAGQRARSQPPRDPRQRLVAAGVNGVLAVLSLVALVGVLDRGTEYVYASPDVYRGSGPSGPGLTHPDGTPITNLFPYSADGRPLTGVLLYDQDGRAVDELSTTTEDGDPVERVTAPGSPPAPANSYPQQQRVLRTDEYGRPVEELVPPTNGPASSPSTVPTAPAVPTAPTAAPPAPGTAPSGPGAAPPAASAPPAVPPAPPSAAPPAVGP